MYYKGEGVEKDLKQAFEWFGKAAQQGDAEAQRRVAWMHYKGEGVEKDLKQAFEWFGKAAQQGDADAQRMLAWMYYEGEGVEKDLKQAFEWLSKAAQQGETRALRTLSLMYREGTHVEQDRDKAMQFLMQSVEWGKPGIQSLDFQGCQIDDDMVASIASQLHDNAAILRLKLANNLVGNEGVPKLADMLGHNAALQVLDLRNNPVGYPGLRAIAQAMRSNTTLRELRLSLPPSHNNRLALESNVIEAECKANRDIATVLDGQQKWLAYNWNGLPLDLMSLLEQTLIRTDIKLHNRPAAEVLQRVQEMQLCLSNVQHSETGGNT